MIEAKVALQVPNRGRKSRSSIPGRVRLRRGAGPSRSGRMDEPTPDTSARPRDLLRRGFPRI